MSGDPPRHPSPYPAADEWRQGMDGWRGTVDEWRRGVDAQLRRIEREGLATAVAVMGVKLDQVVADAAATKRLVEELDDDRQRRRGITLTGRTAALLLGALAALGSIIGLLVALVTGGPG